MVKSKHRSETQSSESRIRLDKWLWAARFFRHRNLAKEAIEGGKVLYNGYRAKPARDVEVGARIRIRKAGETWEIIVKALSDRRGPAAEAQQLYAETEESTASRAVQREERRVMSMSQLPPARRPTKRDRRHIHRFMRDQESDS